MLVAAIFALFFIQQAFAQEDAQCADWNYTADGSRYCSETCADWSYTNEGIRFCSLYKKQAPEPANFLETIFNFFSAPFQTTNAPQEQKSMLSESYEPEVRESMPSESYTDSYACVPYAFRFFTKCKPNETPKYINVPAYCPMSGRRIISCKEKGVPYTPPPAPPKKEKAPYTPPPASPTDTQEYPCMPQKNPQPIHPDFGIGNDGEPNECLRDYDCDPPKRYCVSTNISGMLQPPEFYKRPYHRICLSNLPA